VWRMKGPVTEVVFSAGIRETGCVHFVFEHPVRSDDDLIRNLHAILPRLKELAAKSTMAGDAPTDTGGMS